MSSLSKKEICRPLMMMIMMMKMITWAPTDETIYITEIADGVGGFFSTKQRDFSLRYDS